MKKFPEFLKEQGPYASYCYSYPHKTAYRKFDREIKISDLWADEKKEALFVYIHIPFCEWRCSYCNLFSVSRPKEELVAEYVNALERQARATMKSLGSMRCSNYAIGGGTPSWLDISQLERLFSIFSGTFGQDITKIPGSIEISPGTATHEKLALFASRQVERISIGIQSFDELERKSLGRNYSDRIIADTLERIKSFCFPRLNIDLIYGIPEQTERSWIESLKTALRYQPEELYIYPLYVRPLTRLGKKGTAANPWEEGERKANLYKIGREFLLEKGYRQSSMRMFSKSSNDRQAKTTYCCQEDGMIGLGTNSRSYTKKIHYSTEYSIGRTASLEIIENFINQTEQDFLFADHGIFLSEEEQKRRYIIKSILNAEGLDTNQFNQFFPDYSLQEFEELNELQILNLLENRGDKLILNAEGLALSDAIGPWMISDSIREKMNAFNLR